MFEVYQSVLLGLWLTLSIIIIQAVVLVRVHRRHKGYKVGVDGYLAIYHNMKYFLIGSVINIPYHFFYLCYFLFLQ